MNYDSHHHTRIKSSIIKCLETRAKNVCHATKLIGEENHLKQIFQVNGYTQHRRWTGHSGTDHTPPLFHPNRRAGTDHHPQMPPLTICERCQREDREELQVPWHHDNLQIEGNPKGSLSANERPITRVDKERSRVPGTMYRMWECLHWQNRKNTGEEDKWTQRSSEETWWIMASQYMHGPSSTRWTG